MTVHELHTLLTSQDRDAEVTYKGGKLYAGDVLLGEVEVARPTRRSEDD